MGMQKTHNTIHVLLIGPGRRSLISYDIEITTFTAKKPQSGHKGKAIVKCRTVRQPKENHGTVTDSSCLKRINSSGLIFCSAPFP